ncbi:MAG: NAD-dependent epimerase/dehydratase family protein [Candidatus Methylomirabilales bacterium]
MAKILVTGGAGFIGSHIVDAYIEAGHEVVVVDSLETGSIDYVNPKARFYHADILDPSLDAIMAQEKPAALNHHAAQASINRSIADPVQDARTNILGSVRLLELARRYGTSHFIFASSGGAVYGVQRSYPADEDHPLNPINAYGIGKLTVERYLEYYRKAYGVRYIALRYANVYGPRQDPHGEAGVVAIFTGNLLHGKRPIVYGDGHQTRDFVYVRDVVRANVLALDLLLDGKDLGLSSSPVFNIATGRATSVLEMVEMLTRILGCSRECQFEPPREGEIRRSILDFRRAREVLDWKPTCTLEEGLRETTKWFLDGQARLKR